jgi:hypothetical protein
METLRSLYYPPQVGRQACVSYREVRCEDGTVRIEQFTPYELGGSGRWETTKESWPTIATKAIECLTAAYEATRWDVANYEHEVNWLRHSLTPRTQAAEADVQRLRKECAALATLWREYIREIKGTRKARRKEG